MKQNLKSYPIYSRAKKSSPALDLCNHCGYIKEARELTLNLDWSLPWVTNVAVLPRPKRKKLKVVAPKPSQAKHALPKRRVLKKPKNVAQAAAASC